MHPQCDTLRGAGRFLENIASARKASSRWRLHRAFVSSLLLLGLIFFDVTGTARKFGEGVFILVFQLLFVGFIFLDFSSFVCFCYTFRESGEIGFSEPNLQCQLIHSTLVVYSAVRCKGTCTLLLSTALGSRSRSLPRIQPQRFLFKGDRRGNHLMVRGLFRLEAVKKSCFEPNWIARG
jgi:hypothetical protein